MSAQNFKDPFGLLKRMLASGNRVAYFVLLREGFNLLCKPLDWLMQPLERRWMRKAQNATPYPVLLILGGSRSGTTLLYQTLAQYLPVSYFSNLTAAFPRAPITATRFFRPFLRRRKGNFANYYGSVAGFDGPNDGFPIWNRWLGENRNTVPSDLVPETLADMQQFFRAWQTAFPQVFINKNNRNSLATSCFEAGLDQVRYLEIRRSPAYVVQSLIHSREAVQGSKYIGWGVNAQDSEAGSDPLQYIDDICRQVFEVEQSLDAVRRQIPADRYLRITYEEFCANPIDAVQAAARFLGIPEIPASQLEGLKPFRDTNTKKSGEQEWERIQSCMLELYGADHFVEGVQTLPTSGL